MEVLQMQDFAKIEMLCGTVLSVEDFPAARKPALQLTVDFGHAVGVKRSSAQITSIYTPESLVGRQVIGVVNLPPKRIGPFVSEFLVLGFCQPDGAVVLAVPDRPVPNGTPLE